MIVETIKEALQGLALDEWTFDGPPHNVIIWRGPEARVCFMTSDGPTRERAKFITACSPVHIAKLISDFEELQRSIQTPAPAVKEWRCFHCDEVFTDEHSAKLHFGMDQCKDPACKIKMGAETSLLVALRKAEQELQDAWMAIHDEATEAAKAYYAQQSRHGEQLRAAEELGFERGIADSARHIAALEEKVTALTRNEFAFTYEPTGERVSLYSSNSNAFAIIAKHPEFLSLVVAARAEIERRPALASTEGKHHAE